MSIHTLPFSTNDFYKHVGNARHGQDSENPRVRFVGVVAEIVSQLVLPLMPEVLKLVRPWEIMQNHARSGEKHVKSMVSWLLAFYRHHIGILLTFGTCSTPRKVARDCDWILCSALARHMCFCIGRELRKRVGLVHLQPLAPTRAFPHYSREDAVACILRPSEPSEDYEESYWSLERCNYDFLEAISGRKPGAHVVRRTSRGPPRRRAARRSASRSCDPSWRAPRHLESDLGP